MVAKSRDMDSARKYLSVVQGVLGLALLFLPVSAVAQQAQAPGMMGDMTCPCPMSGPLGTVIMALAALLLIAVIGALVALTIFLLRRSRPGGPAQA